MTTALAHNQTQVICVGGPHDGETITVDWPQYSNTGGYGARQLFVDGSLYVIETVYLTDGSHWSFLRSPHLRPSQALAQLMSSVTGSSD